MLKPHAFRRPAFAALIAAAVLSLTLAACRRNTDPAPQAAATAASAATATASAPPQAPSLTVQLRERADAMLASHRQMIVLMSRERSLKAPERRAVGAVGQMLFHDMQERLDALTGLVANTSDSATVQALDALLDRIESEPSWFDADRLAFKEFLTRVAAQYAQAQSIAGLKIARRANDDLAVLAEVEQAYDRELKDIFGRFAQRGIELKREKWADYVAKLSALYSREQILKDYGTIVPYTPPPGAKSAEEADAREIFGTSLPPKTVVLTFDDGPHPKYTDDILDILKRYDAPAIFFNLGRNLGTVDASGKARLGANAAVAKRVLAAGHLLANHSYTHSVMAKMGDDAVRSETVNTEALLDAEGRAPTPLFRFPYGARNESALATVESLKLHSMMWTVDSLDWADPVPKSIAERVLAEVDKAQRGIILFHDIQGRTVQALPVVLDQLVADGYRFATWRDGHFVVSTPRQGGSDAALAAASGDSLYRDSHALIVGIDQYAKWPGLHHAVKDAKAMQDALVSRFGFKPENVTALYDAEATRANILRALNDKLADAKRVKRDDRVMVFFAGHGGTRKLTSGRDVGYLIPVDASITDFSSDAISMPQLQEVAEAMSAKHVLFMVDACYSGLGLTRGGAVKSANFLSDNARRLGRQMITAGGADQQVADDGPGGHSVFTWTVLQALGGKADLNGDGVITSTELAAYVAPSVSAIAHQTPAFGSLPGSQGGEFVFELPVEREALSGDTRQLDADASKLAKRIDDAKTAALQPQAAPGAKAASAVQVTLRNLDGGETKISMPAASELPPRVAAQRANDRGLALYREQRYDDAEQAFTEALKWNPKFALAANNLGFVYFKRGKPVEAARWFEKAIEIDGSRALAYLNLGDAYLQAGDDAKAQAAYTTFVGLSPRHVRVAQLQAWLASPDKKANRPMP